MHDAAITIQATAIEREETALSPLFSSLLFPFLSCDCAKESLFAQKSSSNNYQMV